MRRLKPRPIVTGILVDSVGSLVLAILYFVVIFGIQIVRGASIADQALALSGSQLVVTEVLGLLLTAVGGFCGGSCSENNVRSPWHRSRKRTSASWIVA
jgi:hypothetical protein